MIVGGIEYTQKDIDAAVRIYYLYDIYISLRNLLPLK